jgi:hypothetical protein
MSRVVYSQTASTPEQEQLRTKHQVRVVTDLEEGTGVSALPPGVYGFTYAPALASAPLFVSRRFRSYEIHKLADGDALLIGFASEAHARALDETPVATEIVLQPEPEEGAECLVLVPYERIAHHRQYAVHTEHGVKLQVSPAASGG